jgi:hypothetical protein
VVRGGAAALRPGGRLLLTSKTGWPYDTFRLENAGTAGVAAEEGAVAAEEEGVAAGLVFEQAWPFALADFPGCRPAGTTRPPPARPAVRHSLGEAGGVNAVAWRTRHRHARRRRYMPRNVETNGSFDVAGAPATAARTNLPWRATSTIIALGAPIMDANVFRIAALTRGRPPGARTYCYRRAGDIEPGAGGGARRGARWWCAVCEVACTTELDLAAHDAGKNHRCPGPPRMFKRPSRFPYL